MKENRSILEQIEDEKKQEKVRKKSLHFFYTFSFALIFIILITYKNNTRELKTNIINNDIEIDEKIKNNNNNKEVSDNEPGVNNNNNSSSPNIDNNSNNSSSPNIDNNNYIINPPINNILEKNKTVVFEQDRPNLKIRINLIERNKRTSFYVTQIWVEDVYNQFKTSVPKKYGQELKLPKELLSYGITKNNLSQKLVVSTNAGTVVLKGVFGKPYYAANSEWNNTSSSVFTISEGNIFKDFSSSVVPENPAYVYGITKYGYLKYYKYKGGTDLSTYQQYNISVTDKIKNDGVKDTFAAKPILVSNKKITTTGTDQNIRQGLCQIDKNNFIIITDVYDDARNGFSFKELAEYMINLGCVTGFNLDGGGSTSLLYKNCLSTEIKILVGNTRQLSEVIYFSE